MAPQLGGDVVLLEHEELRRARERREGRAQRRGALREEAEEEPRRATRVAPLEAGRKRFQDSVLAQESVCRKYFVA